MAVINGNILIKNYWIKNTNRLPGEKGCLRADTIFVLKLANNFIELEWNLEN